MTQMRTPKQSFLMTPGPVTISETVSAALAKPVLFHRYSEFQSLFLKTCNKLRDVFDAPKNHKIFLLSGSGTLANEATLSSVFNPDDKVLVLSNGDFGERIIKILEIHHIECCPLRISWGERFNVQDVESLLSNSSITGVAMVALETSTGMVNPVHEVGQFCQRYQKVFFVDAVSALGAETLSVKKDGIDLCTSVPNKGLEGPPGIGIVCVNTSVFQSRKPSHPRSMYLDLYRYDEYAQREQTPTTPAVPIIRALDSALDRLLQEGMQNRQERYRRLSRLLLEHVTKMGIKPFISDSSLRAKAVLTLCFPTHIDITAMHDYFLTHGITLWKPIHPGPLAPYNIMQLSVMGDIDEPEATYFLDLLHAYLSKHPA